MRGDRADAGLMSHKAMMSNNIDRLKQLLFEAEKETLANLEGRLERMVRSSAHDRETFARKLREIVDEEAGHRREIGKQLEAVFARAGTVERFRNSVAQILDSALRQAEVDRHQELSEAVAPLVVRTIKTEIHNSKDDLVEALYPITGRMVKAYVGNAIRDLTQQINRRIEANPFMLRMKSLTTGRSVAELALAESQTLELEELYIVRRGSGELIARWPEAPASANRDQVMSGILTAINEFAVEAFQADASSLRQIDLGNSRIYLRASPSYLLAAKCKGVASPNVEQIIDDEFLTTISSTTGNTNGNGVAHQSASAVSASVPALAERLDTRLSEERTKMENASLGASPTRGLLVVACLLLAAWLSWTLYESYGHTRVESLTARILSGADELQGYPVRAEVAPYGAEVDIIGLAPTEATKANVLQKLRTALPGTRLNDQLTVVSVDTYDPGPELAGLREDMAVLRRKLTQRAVHYATSRTSRRLHGISTDLDQLAVNLKDSTDKAKVARSKVEIKAILSDLDQHVDVAASSTLSHTELVALRSKLGRLTDRIAAETRNIQSLLVNNAAAASGALRPLEPSRSDLTHIEEELSIQAERLATLIIAANQAFAIKPPPQPTPPPIIERVEVKLTPRQKLEAWTAANAIFFGESTNYRNSQRAENKLDRFADLLNNNNILIRVVGFTDEKGPQDRNVLLSEERAQKVRLALIQRGIAPARLVAVGRENTIVLSPVIGRESPNRRVQFELGFEDEFN